MKTRKTITKEVIAANRANAKKSRGPSNSHHTRQNARKHGLLSKQLNFESEEEKEDFENLLADLEDERPPTGTLERIVLEETALAVWKLRMSNGWEAKALVNRRKSAKAVLKLLSENCDSQNMQILGDEENSQLAAHSWDCQEMLIRTGTRSIEEEDDSLSSATSRVGHAQIEAKLTTSLDTVLRYRGAIRRDFYKAMAALRDLRSERDTRGGHHE